jgi:hypothetical protein
LATASKTIEAPASAGQTKWLACNGRQLRHMAQAGLIWLEANYQHVNSLNVFPVPDGDTGTNMLMTMRSAFKRIEGMEDLHVGKVATQLAQGALMGARGNSGVILSQIWRGFGNILKDRESFDAQGLAAAMQGAADTAYKGVMRPVEGTILTIIREAAAEAADAAHKSSDLRFMMERVLERCKQALERTPEQLPILKQAGVVDSGGQGLIYIFEGMLRYAQGELKLNGPVIPASQPAVTLPPVPAAALNGQPAQALAAPDGGDLEFPYDVQFILVEHSLDVDTVRDAINAMGDSCVVAGDDQAIKVHIHVKDPGVPLSYGARHGRVMDVVVENMQEQMEGIIGKPAESASVPEASPAAAMAQATLPPADGPDVQPGQVAVVAVASGPGLARIFRSLGAAAVINGGQTNNPSTEEIFQALQDVGTDKIIILPNNKNIFLAAEAARDLSPKQVKVVQTRSVPQGISALLNLNPDGDLDANAETMTEAAGFVATGEITTATRTVSLHGVDVQAGSLIGLVNGKLCSSALDVETVLDEMLDEMDVESRELMTIYVGADGSTQEAEALAERVRIRNAGLEVEIQAGGQPHYYYILGAE